MVAFLADMWALLDKTGNVDLETLPLAGSTLTNLKVEDGKATGDLVTTRDGKEHRQRIEFHRIDGRWFVHLIRNHNGITDQAVSGSRLHGTAARVWPRVAVGLSLVVGMVGQLWGFQLRVLRLFAAGVVGSVAGGAMGCGLSYVFITTPLQKVLGPRYAEFDVFGVIVVTCLAALIAWIGATVAAAVDHNRLRSI